VLLLYGEKDEIIPQVPVIEFHERLPPEEKWRHQLILYENGYHMLLRDRQAKIVRLDIVEWINRHAKAKK
jgi:acylglycerol lipase